MSKAIKVGLAILAAASLAAPPARANLVWDLQPSGTGQWDWKMSGFQFTYQCLLTSSDLCDLPWSGIAWNPSAPHCIELATSPGPYTANPDTRIWIDDHSTLRSINDDFGGTWQSRARIWIDRTSSSLEYYVHIKAYNSWHNQDDFGLSVTRLELNQSQCTTGQTTIPWAAIVGYAGTYTVTLSPNAG